MVSTLFAATVLLDPLGLFVHTLRPGLTAPSDGAHCADSPVALGTILGQGATRPTTVVNLWFVRVANQPMGWVAKTAGGAYWYQSPDGAYFEQITALNARELRQKTVSIGGCFSHDLALTR